MSKHTLTNTFTVQDCNPHGDSTLTAFFLAVMSFLATDFFENAALLNQAQVFFEVVHKLACGKCCRRIFPLAQTAVKKFTRGPQWEGFIQHYHEVFDNVESRIMELLALEDRLGYKPDLVDL